MIRLAAAVCFAAALALPANVLAQTTKTRPLDRIPRLVEVVADPLPSFSRTEPEQTRFGSLEFLGGLVLHGNDERFGGLSGLRFLNESDNTFLAITDRGHWVQGRLVLDGQRPVGIERLAIAPMLDANRSALASGPMFDTEALALGYGGEVFVGIERVHRILRYDFGKRGFFALGRTVDTPRAMSNLPRNQGIEGLVFVPHNRPVGNSLIAFSERGLDRDGNLRAFIIGGQTPGEFSVRRHDDFSITDAALIPGGDIVILERYFSWLRGIGMRVRLIRLSDIRPGATVDGPVLIQAGNEHQIDNMEGIAVQRTEDGETFLTIVSDDNFSRLQRTLLLRFRLVDEDAVRAEAGR